VARFRQSSSGEVASRNENSLRCRTQRSPEVVNFGAPDRVPPALDLRLHVGSGEKLVRLVNIGVHINSAVSRGPGYGNPDESTSFEYELDEMFKVVRCELE